MKAITLTQPWATLVAIGAKRIETRSWSTKYRGPLAIHAGQDRRFVDGRNSKYYVCGEEPFLTILTRNAEKILKEYPHPLESARRILPRGCVIATCNLIDCILIEEDFMKYGWMDYQELVLGDFTFGRFAWRLEDIQLLAEPVEAKGMLGLWEWEK